MNEGFVMKVFLAGDLTKYGRLKKTVHGLNYLECGQSTLSNWFTHTLIQIEKWTRKEVSTQGNSPSICLSDSEIVDIKLECIFKIDSLVEYFGSFAPEWRSRLFCRKMASLAKRFRNTNWVKLLILGGDGMASEMFCYSLKWLCYIDMEWIN